MGSWSKEQPGYGMRLVSPTNGETPTQGMAKLKAEEAKYSQAGTSDQKKESRGSMGSRINPYYSENGRAVHMRKGLTGYIACKGNTVRTCRAGETVRTSLQGIAGKARADHGHRFQNLFGMIDKVWLLESWKYLNKNAAWGVYKIGARDAITTLTRELLFGRYGYVFEADIKGFFDHMSHEWVLRML